MGSRTTWKPTVTRMESRTNRAVQLPRMAFASSILPSPMRTTAREPPPIPTRAEMAETNMMTGKQMPSPVRARSPTPSMWPMYIRSTMLYRALTSWAVTAGTARRTSSGPMGSLPRSFSRFATGITPPHFPGNTWPPYRPRSGQRPGGTAGGPAPPAGRPLRPKIPCASGWPWPPPG